SRLIEKEIITKTPGGGRGRLTHYTLNYKIPPERRSKGPSFPHRLNNDASGPTPQPAKNPKPNKARPVISPLLQTPGFTQAWNDWYQYRKEIRHPMTPTSERKLLEKCVTWGQERAIAAIEHSISNGYQGLFEPRDSQSGKPERQTPKLNPN